MTDTPHSPRKCADIDDEQFMAAVAATAPRHGVCWRNRGDVRATLERMLGATIPEKLFLAKARKLGRRRKLEGCTDCSCRGDYHLPRECHARRCCYPRDHDWSTHPGYDPSWEADECPAYDPAAFEKAIADSVAALNMAALPQPASRLVPFDLGRPATLIIG